MPTITIRIEVPEGAKIEIDDHGGLGVAPAPTDEPSAAADDIARYWSDYLSDNGRELYAAAAAIERNDGPGFTLDDVADRMGRVYASAQSIHRTTGRAARKWKEDTGKEPPIRLEWIDYTWDDSQHGMRTRYRLPEGVAVQIDQL
jgi:hypothetical protein